MNSKKEIIMRLNTRIIKSITTKANQQIKLKIITPNENSETENIISINSKLTINIRNQINGYFRFG